tara:strand:+ start:410 stop:610 length:201 start_codon:yes stop_codon:yes gene_type:complete
MENKKPFCFEIVESKEIIEKDTIWLVYYDENNDELYRQRIEKVKERWNKEAEQALDYITDQNEKWR